MADSSNLPPLVVAIGGAVAAIITALVPAIIEWIRKRNLEGKGSTPAPRPWLVFFSIAGVGMGITALLVAFLHAQGPPGPPGPQGIQGPALDMTMKIVSFEIASSDQGPKEGRLLFPADGAQFDLPDRINPDNPITSFGKRVLAAELVFDKPQVPSGHVGYWGHLSAVPDPTDPKRILLNGAILSGNMVQAKVFVLYEK